MTIGKQWAITALVGMAFIGCQKAENEAEARTLSSEKDKVSYAIGLDIGKSLKQQNLGADDVDLKKMRVGILDALTGTKSVLSDSQLNETMMAFQKSMMAKQDSLNKVKADANQKASDSFFAKNGKEAGIITTASGLQYKIITEGTGKKPDSTNTVTVHYAGTLLDGTEFDSSIKRGQPVTFPVTGVIKGWTEALQLMPVGSKWKLFIPSSLGYGPRGAGGQIGPNAALIFDVELISIAEPTKPDAHDPHAGHAH